MQGDGPDPVTPHRTGLFSLKTPKKTRLPQSPLARAHSVRHLNSSPSTLKAKAPATTPRGESDVDPFTAQNTPSGSVAVARLSSPSKATLGKRKRDAEEDVPSTGRKRRPRVQVLV